MRRRRHGGAFKRACALSMLAAVALSLGAAALPAAAATVSARTYLHAVCPALKSWQADLTSAGDSLQRSVESAPTLTQAKAEILSFLSSANAKTDTVIGTVAAAGVPNVKSGAKIAGALNSALMKLSVAFLGVGDAASSLPTDDPTAFASQAEKLANGITSQGNAVRKSLTTAAKKYASPQLDQAAKRERACKGLIG